MIHLEPTEFYKALMHWFCVSEPNLNYFYSKLNYPKLLLLNDYIRTIMKIKNLTEYWDYKKLKPNCTEKNQTVKDSSQAEQN